MSFIKIKTIDGSHLWLNLARVGAFSYSEDERICLVEISGGEPHQIPMEEFSKVEPMLMAHPKKPKRRKK